MNRLLEQDARPRIRIALRSTESKTEVRIQVNWHCQVSARVVGRLLVVLALALAASAVAMPANDELARGVLYSVAGFLTGSRPRTRS